MSIIHWYLIDVNLIIFWLIGEFIFWRILIFKKINLIFSEQNSKELLQMKWYMIDE